VTQDAILCSFSEEFAMRRTSIRKTLAVCGLILLPLSIVAVGPKRATAQDIEPQAAGGSLDTSFGNGGIVTTDFFGHSCAPEALVVQPDGKIVVAGSTVASDQSGYDFALARYNHDGSLDSSFGAGGKVTTDFFQHSDQAVSMALQPDGKVVVVGSALITLTKLVAAVARYNSDGSLDTGFGAGGKATMDFGGDFSAATAVVLQSDGKIVIAGVLRNAQNTFWSFIVARLTPSGAPDAGFGSGGMITGPSIKTFNAAIGLATQPDGKIIVSGYAGADTAATQVFAVLRFNVDGTLDSGFGTGGFVTTDFLLGLGSVGDNVLLLPDGRIIVAGTARDSQGIYYFALARYNPDGTLDSAFGNGGKVTTSFPGGKAATPWVAHQADGKIVAAGYFQAAGSGVLAIALARYNADGSLDTNFGTAGRTTTSVFGIFDVAKAIAIQADGNIVVAVDTQKTQDLNSEAFSVLRYLGGSANFSLAFSQLMITADRGTKVKIGISINRAAGFSGNVTITPPDSVQGVKFKPPDPISTTDPTVSLKLKIAATAPTGPQQLTFTGKSDDGQVSTATLTLNIQ
jgi:uncharacterized delta-60 repeat protein